MDTNTTEQAKKAGSFLSGLLSGWGVPANWARVLAGAIIGAALAAAGLFGTTSCTASLTQSAEGDFHYQGCLMPLGVEEENK